LAGGKEVSNMIELYLSSDGKHTVHVAAETPAQMNVLANYADALYARVLQQYGTKPQLWEAARTGQTTGQTNGHASAEKRSAPAAQAPADAPLCPEHERPLAYRQGRFGAFWSCPTRRPDGSWCTYTVQVSQTSNGQAVPEVSA
jgi:hypothetical protein